MLFKDFLDTLVDRFLLQSQVVPAQHIRPPYSLKMLVNLSLISLYPPISLDQMILFLTFLFPYLAQPSAKSAFKREDFRQELESDSRVETIRNAKGEHFYLLLEGRYPELVGELGQFFSTKSNSDRLMKSIDKQEYVNLLLPSLKPTMTQA